MSRHGQAPAPESCPPMTSMPPVVRDLSTPPAGPVMCFPCMVATCTHKHCDGVIPAVTYYKGTALCLDCASVTAGVPPPGGPGHG